VNDIAQLIKLKDYISRYDWNTYHYPSHFIRLKQENWKKQYEQWEASGAKNTNAEADNVQEDNTPSIFSRWRAFVSKNKPAEPKENIEEVEPLPTTEKKLKQHFLNKLFPLQLKWASSTVRDESFLAEKYEEDNELKYFLQRFPDTYLLMYYPVFSIQQAPVDGEIILISPIGIEIIHLVEAEPEAMIMASDERTWAVNRRNDSRKILNPVIALKRTEQIVSSILRKNEIDFPVHKSVVSRTNDLLFSSEPFHTSFIGKNEYENWFQEKRKLISPLKKRQLKVAEVLLHHCKTVSVKRPEWEAEDSLFPIGSENIDVYEE